MARTYRLFEMIQLDKSVVVISPLDKFTDSELVIRTMGEAWLGIARLVSRPKIILDFKHVEMLSNLMLGRIINLYNAVAGQRGEFVMCNVNDDIATILEAGVLHHTGSTFNIRKNRKAALATFK